ncbi:non-ribosomal peptide synthetase-like protein [Kitasatospora sp. GP30]|uniref:Pls/PosA family non-ribosomal peptide synthetase n=1 Tax=Kitasatospora sp. GP30 TaxID=3035084 RepID=UPI000C714F63|nr:Pls/PosA family non-ribosomal peptide synthetase [Kitasatospora sp. GP30]MDH6143638.1 non-ribosomal peptide synthetase-like protein [Kitasatospora sp. GP30]
MAPSHNPVSTLPEHRPAREIAAWPVAHPAPPRTLIDILLATAAACPQAPALDAGGVLLDYQGLVHHVAAYAEELGRHGIGAGDRVGIRVPSGTADLYVAILAVLWAGATYVPVDADDPDERAEMIWQDAQVCAVIGAERRLAMSSVVGPGCRAGGPGPGGDAWIIFTSGTTGRPKGVAVTHRSAAAFVDAEARLFLQRQPLGPGDRVLAGLSVAFDASCEEMWLAWRHGACLVPAPRSLVKAGTDLGPWLVERRISAVSTVPTLLALWPQECLDQVRLIIVGGESCPPELVERLAAPHREFWNTYGPTETTVVATAHRMLPGEPVRIGLPLDGWQIAVVDEAGYPVAWGETGELLISGVGTARYLDPAKDAEKFVAHPALPGARVYRSGDLVQADPRGLLFVGRADEQVKLGGRRIELGEVDAALQALPGVRAAAAAVRTNPAGTQLLVGYLVPQPGAALDLAAARTQLTERLPAALVPLLATVDQLPTRTSGKVDRNALPWPLPGLADRTGPAERLTGTAGWLAEQWEASLGLPVSSDSDFFALGGSSLVAARLVSVLRTRYPSVGVADLYAHPVLADLAAALDEKHGGADQALGGAPAAPREKRRVRRTPRRAAVAQSLVLAVLYTLASVRWVLLIAAINNLMGGHLAWAPHTPWWLIIGGLLLLGSTPGRVLLAGTAARVLTARLRPGSYPRGGLAHLRLWAAERTTASFNTGELAGTPWARHYAKLLGCRVGKGAHLHAVPPVTGLAVFGAGCSVEPGVDLAGWWLDGDLLHLGSVEIGADARVGTRATLMPGARVGTAADVAPGSCVLGTVPPGSHYHGSPARPNSEPQAGWPAPRRGHAASRAWNLAYGLGMLLFGLLPVISTVPALCVLYPMLDADHTLQAALLQLLPTTALLTALTMSCYALLLVLLVRLFSRAIQPGFHPEHGKVAWCVWAVSRLMDTARRSLFPFYASLFTPVWLRLLGARIGRRVEASTVLALPGLMRVDDGAFLADDTLIAPFEVRGGWLRIGPSAVGQRAFVGNSGIVGPGTELPDRALVGVLSDAPVNATPGSSWLGRPGIELPRVADAADEARTYAPPRRLLLARATVELCRLLPVILTVLLGDLVFGALEAIIDQDGLAAALAVGGVVLAGATLAACLVTTLAKWLLVGKFRSGEHPLWSAFVWRNELYDTFVEELAMPWGGQTLLGTPYMNMWLRSLGAKIGRGAWCETHWLPESDLVSVGSGASVNRGTVLQTHLFHDRVMRLGPVVLDEGATLGPNSIVLPGTTVGAGASIGAASLAMRGEEIPDSTRWIGNPIAAWPAEHAATVPAAARGRHRHRARARVRG